MVTDSERQQQQTHIFKTWDNEYDYDINFSIQRFD